MRRPPPQRRFAAEWRSVVLLAVLAALLQVLDLLTFFQAVAVAGLSVELNPLARALFAQSGPAGLAAGKLAVAFGVPALLASHGLVAARVPLVRAALVAAIFLGVIGALSNLVVVYL